MTPLSEQLEQIHAMSQRHYPDDPVQRTECLVRLLTERLRTYHQMFVESSRPRPAGYDDLRRMGFTDSEISLGSQEVVR